MDNTTIITGQGTTTIPKIFRNNLGYECNVRIFWYELDGLLIISKNKIENVEEKILEE